MHGTHYKPRLFCQRIWNKGGLALLAGLVVLATVTEAEESNTEIHREKVAAEEDLQAHQNVRLPTAQRSTLETELKKAQERARLAEQMADLAKSQQSALEAELKRALWRAQLAEKNAERTERKLSALEAALAEKDDEPKKAQERVQLAEKNVDLNDPNAGPKAEPLASTQPSDSSVQSAETTARPGPASNSVPAAIESRNEENRGIGFAKATALNRLTMISPQENSLPQMGTPGSSQIPVPALASEINQPDASPESFARGHDSARMIPPNVLNIRHRSVVPSRFVDVKARLIALWHQSLARSQRDSGRTVLSNSKKDANRKAEAKTNH